MAVAGGETLELLLAENAALQAENDALRMEAAQFGVIPESTSALADLLPAAEAQERLDNLRREHEVLTTAVQLGDDLQDLREVNERLRDEAERLRRENATLQEENAALRASRASTPAVSARGGPLAAGSLPAPAPGTSTPRPYIGPPQGKVCANEDPTDFIKPQYDVRKPGGLILPEGIDQEIAQIAAAINRQDQEAVSKCSEAKRKELVAAMLKASLCDAFRNPLATPAAELAASSKKDVPRWVGQEGEDISEEFAQELAIRGALQGLTASCRLRATSPVAGGQSGANINEDSDEEAYLKEVAAS